MRAPITSFSAGEVSPEIAARMDLAKYGSALREATNVIGLREGGVRNRPGFLFVGQVRNSVDRVRLIPFQFSATDAYALEFAFQKMRVVYRGAYVTHDPVAVTVALDPLRVTTAQSNGWRTNQHLVIDGVSGVDGPDGLSLINGRTFRVDPDYDDDNDALTVPLVGLDGHPFEAPAGAAPSGGAVKAIFELDTPFTADELAEVRFEQSADVMYLAHPAHPLQRLARTDHDAWTIEDVDFRSHVKPPQSVSAAGTAGEGTQGELGEGPAYRVSSFNDDTGQESLISETSNTVSNDLSLVGAYNTVSWAAPDPADGWDPPTRYIVYKESNGLYGFIGSTTADPAAATQPEGNTGGTGGGVIDGGGGGDGGGVSPNGAGGSDVLDEEGGETPAPRFSFKDDNIDPDLGSGPMINADPLSGVGNYAGAVGFYEQRLFLAGTDNKPNGVWGSRSADFANMNYSRPLHADDALSFGISARQVNRVLHLLPMSDLLAFTSESVFKVTGTGGDPIGPASISVKPQVHRGASAARPLVIDETVLYVTAKGGRLRNLGYQFAADAWQGTDLTVMAGHLFRGRRIVETAWVEHPHSAVFCVLDDGTLLCLTWMPEQEITGWSRLVTEGKVQSICAVTENGQDSLYAVVQRTRPQPHGDGFGQWRYVERLATPFEEGVRKKPALCDSDPAQAAADGLCCCDVSDSGIEYAAYLDSAVGYCGAPAHVFSGLEHLERRTVSALADGNVVHGLLVENGRVTLPEPATVVTVGIPYTARIRTLPVVTEGGAGKRQGAARAVVRLLESRGMKVGADPARLEPPKPRLDAGWGEPSDLISGDCEVVFDAAWSSELGITVEQAEPLPMTVLGVYPDVQAGG